MMAPRVGAVVRRIEVRMIYVKSLVMGLAAAVAALILSPFAILLYFVARYRPTGDEAIGWDPVSLLQRPPIWLVILISAMFIVGFVWEFRRAAK